jgi:hypothetical protein
MQTVSKEAQTVTIPIIVEEGISEITDITMSAVDWCTFEWTESEITATVQENLLPLREVTFTITSPERTGAAILRQEGRDINAFKQHPMTDWEVVDFSDQIVSDGGGAAAILNLDNPHGTFWHSDWGSGAPLPHWIIIDMKQSLTLDMVQLGWRQNGSNFYLDNKITEIYVGNDSAYASFTDANKIGSLRTLAPNGRASAMYPAYNNVGLSGNNTGRYLMLKVTESNNGVNSIIAYVKAYDYEGTD